PALCPCHPPAPTTTPPLPLHDALPIYDLSGNAASWAIVSPDSKDGMFAHAQRLHAAGIPFVFDLGQAMPLFDGDDLRSMLKMARDRKSTRLNSSHVKISYAVFCLKKKR